MAVWRGKHKGKSAAEPTTDAGRPFGQLTGEQKAAEFDASIADPGGYADRNFDTENNGEAGKGRHRRES